MKKLWISGVAILMTACTANPHGYKNTEQIAQRLVGMSANELVSKLGSPIDTVQFGEGAKSLSFRQETGGLTGSLCTISVIVHDHTVYSANVTAERQSWIADPMKACLLLIQPLDTEKTAPGKNTR